MYETVRGELLKMIGELETKKETETLSTRIPELLSHLEAWQQKALILSSFEGKDIIQLCNDMKQTLLHQMRQIVGVLQTEEQLSE